jgi:hypothetical protein
MAEGIRYAHAQGQRVLMAINTFPQAGREADWHAPSMRRRPRASTPSSWPTSACSTTPATAIRAAPAPLGAGLGHQLRSDQFLPARIRHPRAVLPRVLTLAQVEHVIKNTRSRSRSSASAACA